jgi:hypothetical protein
MEVMAPEPGAKPAVNPGDEGRVFALLTGRRLSLNTAYRAGAAAQDVGPGEAQLCEAYDCDLLDLGREEARDLPAHSGHPQTPVDTSSWEWAYVDLALSRM